MNPAKPTAARGRPRDVDRAARRDALLETAMRAFLEYGYGQTSIEMIAGQARVAKRTIYATVGDKADLFVAVVRRLGDRVVRPVTDSSDNLRTFCLRLVTLMLSDEAIGLHRLVIAEAANFPDLAQRLYTNGPQRYIDVLSEMTGSPETAEQLFTLLLGERQRRRLLCLETAPSVGEVASQVDRTLAVFLVS
jgi:AcrR family transcriptional regulator